MFPNRHNVSWVVDLDYPSQSGVYVVPGWGAGLDISASAPVSYAWADSSPSTTYDGGFVSGNAGFTPVETGVPFLAAGLSASVFQDSKSALDGRFGPAADTFGATIAPTVGIGPPVSPSISYDHWLQGWHP